MSKSETIDLTPSWRAILPMLLTAFTDAGDAGRQMAREELERMAALADLAVSVAKQNGVSKGSRAFEMLEPDDDCSIILDC